VAVLLKKFKWLIILLVVFLVIFIVVNILFGIFARQIVIDQIQNNLNTPVKLESISLSLPLCVNLSGLEVGSLAKVKKLSVSINPLGFLAKKVVISNLSMLEPQIFLTQGADGSMNLPVLKQGGNPPPVYLTGIQIKNGRVIFTDKKVSSGITQIIIEKLRLNASKDMLPVTSLNVRFDFSADFTDTADNRLGNVSAEGWVDLGPKNMDAKIQVKDLEITQFAPYYGNFISNKKISSGKLNLTSMLKAKNNQLEIVNNFRLSGLVYAQQEQVKNALDLFTDKSGNLDLEFTINTQLDKPALDPDKLKGMILKAAMKNLANQPPEELAEKVMDTVDKIKEFSKGLKEIFN
jgi:uncharacterized protein involved in outer membrane biogenesis